MSRAVKVNFKLNRQGVGELLKSSSLAADIQERTNAIAGTAGDGFEPSLEVTSDRVRGIVKAATAEAKYSNNLPKAIGAGRR